MGNSQVTLADKVKDALDLNFHGDKGSPLSPAESQKKRLQICEEILATERSYVGMLRIAIEFKARMESFVKPEEIKVIFSSLESIVALHEKFLQALSERLEGALKKKGYYTLIVGDVFAEYASAMPLYTPYVDNFEKSSRQLQSLQKSRKRGKQMKELEDELKKTKSKGLSLIDLLISPVQRIPRYLLLLRSLQEATLEQHKDWPLLQDATRTTASVCDRINEAKREAEQRAALLELHVRCVKKKQTPLVSLLKRSDAVVPSADELIQPHRKHLMTVEDAIVMGDKKKKEENHLLVVCTDAMFLFQVMDNNKKHDLNLLAMNTSLDAFAMDRPTIEFSASKLSVMISDESRTKLGQVIKGVK